MVESPHVWSIVARLVLTFEQCGVSITISLFDNFVLLLFFTSSSYIMSNMSKNYLFILSFICLSYFRVNCEGELLTKGVSQRCKTPTIAPQKLERIIGQCQEEIKSLLLQEALDVIGIENQDGTSLTNPTRTKRQTKDQTGTFTNEERRVAGCLLQCVYKKVKAVDETGFPQIEGLVRLYSEGVQDRNYYLAAFTAVQQCIGIAEAVKQQQPNQKFDGGQICDLAYEMFDCVSDKIDQFCGLTPERT